MVVLPATVISPSAVYILYTRNCYTRLNKTFAQHEGGEMHLLILSGGDFLQEISHALALRALETALQEELQNVLARTMVHQIPCTQKAGQFKSTRMPSEYTRLG